MLNQYPRPDKILKTKKPASSILATLSFLNLCAVAHGTFSFLALGTQWSLCSLMSWSTEASKPESKWRPNVTSTSNLHDLSQWLSAVSAYYRNLSATLLWVLEAVRRSLPVSPWLLAVSMMKSEGPTRVLAWATWGWLTSWFVNSPNMKGVAQKLFSV